jgi:hypothetical protein
VAATHRKFGRIDRQKSGLPIVAASGATSEITMKLTSYLLSSGAVTISLFVAGETFTRTSCAQENFVSRPYQAPENVVPVPAGQEVRIKIWRSRDEVAKVKVEFRSQGAPYWGTLFDGHIPRTDGEAAPQTITIQPEIKFWRTFCRAQLMCEIRAQGFMILGEGSQPFGRVSAQNLAGYSQFLFFGSATDGEQNSTVKVIHR